MKNYLLLITCILVVFSCSKKDEDKKSDSINMDSIVGYWLSSCRAVDSQGIRVGYRVESNAQTGSYYALYSEDTDCSEDFAFVNPDDNEPVTDYVDGDDLELVEVSDIPDRFIILRSIDNIEDDPDNFIIAYMEDDNTASIFVLNTISVSLGSTWNDWLENSEVDGFVSDPEGYVAIDNENYSINLTRLDESPFSKK